MKITAPKNLLIVCFVEAIIIIVLVIILAWPNDISDMREYEKLKIKTSAERLKAKTMTDSLKKRSLNRMAENDKIRDSFNPLKLQKHEISTDISNSMRYINAAELDTVAAILTGPVPANY